MTASAALPSPDGGASDVPRRPRRVAAVIDTYDVSGPGRQLVGVAGAMAREGVEMLVVMFHRAGRPYPPFAHYMAQLGVQFALVPERGPFDRALLPRLRGVLRAWRPDVIETHSYKTTALVYLLRRFGGVRQPWVGFFHGATAEDLKVRLYHWLDVRLLRTADRVVVMSNGNRADFAGLGDRVRVVYNSVVPLPAEPAGGLVLPAVAAAAVARGEPLVGVVGRLSPEKGVDIYLRAVAALEARGVRFMSVLAGDGPQRAASEALSAELGLTHRVCFLGSVQTMQSLYGQLDLLVIPSRSEGLPNVLLEAMHADLPVVSTSVGAIPEVLGGTHAGVLVESGNVVALADAIAASLQLKGNAASRESRTAVANRFSLERRTDEHLRMYGEVMDRAAGVRRP